MAAQRNRLILGYLSWSNLGSGREAGYWGQAQVIDFQCCIFAPLKGWCFRSTIAWNRQASITWTSLPFSELKDPAAIKRLIGYLERNRSNIPCYALRRQLGLPNSSNPIERANNLVTSNRQKHHGMSWSKEGSYALTALSAVVLNGATRVWVRNRIVPFKFVAKAA